MIARAITTHLSEVARYYPVITILGPRQSGKTTLARHHFAGYCYVNLEHPEHRELATRDPQEFLRAYPAPVIIDEVQRAPNLLSYIQVHTDESPGKAQYILTGSHQPMLKEKIAQSLAGRTAIVTLLPLSIQELAQAGIATDRDDYIFQGFMPRIYSDPIPPQILYSNYYKTYVERDVLQLININNRIAFETFIKLLAGCVGQLINLQSMAGKVGVSSTTLAAWLSVLEASYIIFRLPPYYKNFGKRLTKHPKVYFTDVGLASFLLGIHKPEQVARDPLLGGLFENMVVVEALKARYNAGLEPDLYFFRDSNGLEIDLLLHDNQSLLPMEIKAARTFSASLCTSLRKFTRLLPTPCKAAHVIYAGDISTLANGIQFSNFKHTASII